jgi:hypothetical protein
MDDWSHIPDRNALSEPAPDPPSTMTSTPLPARLARPRQVPATGTNHPCPQTGALDPDGLAWRFATKPGLRPENPAIPAPHPSDLPSSHTKVNGPHTSP